MADAKKTTQAPAKEAQATKKVKEAKEVKKAKETKEAVEVKTISQLHEELAKLRTDHRESRRSHRMGELVNPHVLTTQRKTIARTLTAIKQAEAKAAKEEN